MDHQTALVRRNHWASVISASQSRPEGTSIRQWLKDNSIPHKSYYYWLRKFRHEAFSQLEKQGLAPCAAPNQLAEIRMAENNARNIAPEIHFTADAVVTVGACTVALSNNTSPSLTALLLEAVRDAR